MTLGRLAGALLAAGALGAPLSAEPPWASGPFTASPAALLAEARAQADGGHDAVVLLDDVRHELDAAGRCTSRHWMVLKVLSAAGQSDWATLGADWAPWHQERPRLRARVIGADGSVSELDPRTIAESPASELDAEIFSDRRVVRAPLPAVAPGALIEQEIVIEEKAPLFDGGVVRLSVLGRPVPVRTARVSLTHPEALPVATLQRGALGEPRRSVGDGLVRLRWEASSLEPLERPEPGLPSDEAPYTLVGFATGRSWPEVARRYADVVDRTIAGSQLGDVVRAEVRGSKDRAAIAQRLLALVQRDIRYTGLEFGESSLVPRPPSETRAQRYGDCKDKAVYLVALLRAAGLPAQVALLNAGPGPDVHAELAGLGVFDHAIVHVPAAAPGQPEIWIDPTDEFARAGQLPLGDQGRMALIASRETVGLVRTPEPLAAENRLLETREFTLPERGRARVVETSESWGTIELQQRRTFHSAEKKALQQAMESYAKTEYLAKGSVTFDSSAPGDLTRPFRIRLETGDAGRGVVDERQGLVVLFPAEPAQRLAMALGLPDKDEDEAAKPKRRERKADYVFFEPYVHECRYRIVPPPGFAVAALPESGEVAIGTATLSKRFRSEGGAVNAVLRFDSGKRRLSAAELEALRQGLVALRKEKPLAIRFEQVGEAHLTAGRVREALAEFRSLKKLHPREGLHHAQLALALLKAGLGEAARREARAGVAAEPASAAAHRALGWVLQHDLLGRRFKRGFNRAGALEAYRRARELDPEDAVTRGDLAILLEHDADGIRYGSGADLAGALREYRALASDLKEHAFDTNLLFTLVFQRRWDELAEAVKEMEAAPERDALRLVGLAAASPDAALAEAARAIAAPAARRDAIEAAGRTLVQLRLYPEAAALLAAAAPGSANPSVLRGQADALRRTTRHEEAAPRQDDPRGVVQRFLLATWLSRDVAELRSLFARGSTALDGERREDGDDADLERLLRSVRAPMRQMGLPPSVVADLSLALLQLTADGDDAAGYRVRIRGASQGGAFDETAYVIREEGAFKIVTTRHTPWLIGAEALARAERGDLPGARKWLDWAREEISLPGGDDPLAGAPFARLWTRGRQGDLAAVRLAAAALLVSGPGQAARALPLLQEARATADAAARLDVDVALATLFNRESRWSELLEVSGRLREARPESRVAFGYTLAALRSLARPDEVRGLAEARLKLLADDPTALRALAALAGGAGDYPAAAARYQRLVELGVADASDYNNLAWNALFTPATAALEGGVTFAQRAIDLSRRQSSSSLHTLACLYAELGKTSEAHELALAAMDAGGRDEPEAHDWFVLGRLAEQYGELEAAGQAYLKVTRSAAERDLATSTYLLAQRRLAVLRKS